MRLTVITPCYQAKDHIEATLNSVLSQQGEFDLQYLIVDGASTDGTPERVNQVLDRWANFNSQRAETISVELISEPDGGLYEAISKGIRIANGDVVSYINAGDCYLEGALQTVSEVFSQRTEVNWLSGYRLKVNEAGGVIRCQLPFSYVNDFIQKAIYGRFLPFIHQESTFARRSLYDRIDLDELASLRYAGDYYLWNAFARDEELYVINALLAVFRKHENQLSSDLGTYRAEVDAICDKTIGILDWPRILAHLLAWQLPAELKLKCNSRIITP